MVKDSAAHCNSVSFPAILVASGYIGYAWLFLACTWLLLCNVWCTTSQLFKGVVYMYIQCVLRVKGGRRISLTASLRSLSRLSRKCGSLDVLQPYGSSLPVTGIDFIFAFLLQLSLLNMNISYIVYIIHMNHENAPSRRWTTNTEWRLPTRKCVRYAASRPLETPSKNPIPLRVRAFRLNEIAVHRAYELDWRFGQWWFIFWVITHAELAACFLLVHFLLMLRPLRCK
jgi:hypothetical protein